MLIADRVAGVVITLGGLAVLAAVLGICVYLVTVVVPLFGEGDLETPHAAGSAGDRVPLVLELDEPGLAVMAISGDGIASLRTLGTGVVAAETPLIEAPATSIAAIARQAGEERLVVATDQRELLVFDAGIRTRVVGPSVYPARDGGEPFVTPDGGVAAPTGEQGFRVSTLRVEPIESFTLGFAPVSVDFSVGSLGGAVAAIARDGSGVILRSSVRRDFGTGEVTRTVRESVFEASNVVPSAVFLLENDLIVVDSGGSAVWLDPATGEELGRVQLTSGEAPTRVVKLAGGRSLGVGTDAGRLYIWHVARDRASGDPIGLVRARVIDPGFGAPLEIIAPGAVERAVLLATGSGDVAAVHATSAKVLGRARVGSAPARASVSPRGDRLALVTQDAGLLVAEFEPGFPEVTFTTLFLPVTYEGEASGKYIYQSSAAGDDAEVKISLTPLVFGTIKASVFAMLFATPLAVLAAIYSSEFLTPGIRRYVKPTVELMASLPSVVLGYVAAMVVAPLVRDHLSSLILGFATVPLAIVIAAHLWQMLPWRLVGSAGPAKQLAMLASAALVGGVAAWLLGPAFEPVLFRPTASELDAMGETQRVASTGLIPWLQGSVGSPWIGWALVLLAPSMVVVWLGSGRLVGAWLQSKTSAAPVPVASGVMLARLFLLVALSCVLAMVAARIVTATGLDIRDSLLGPFTQRNTLVVGIIMGFAVIPIIYTISDDALTSVPASLRAASLGAGATPWQTALRVVLPVAASGIFSAIMIGLGRAVGETMIVLMATGNTPTMDWNIFGGFRTLAANIAVELPEAPVGGGHYRVLFLCGLVLFVMTLVVNTTAELVRQHFRKKNAML